VGTFCNPSTQQIEAVESQVQCQPELHSETLLQKNLKILKKKRAEEGGLFQASFQDIVLVTFASFLKGQK
jgi:hypothetical protein